MFATKLILVLWAVLLVIQNVQNSPVPEGGALISGPSSDTVITGPDGTVIRAITKGGKVKVTADSSVVLEPPSDDSSASAPEALPENPPEVEVISEADEGNTEAEVQRVLDERNQVLELEEAEIEKQRLAQEEADRIIEEQQAAAAESEER